MMRLIAVLSILCYAWTSQPQVRPNPASVSIVQVISTPERFNGKPITVIGFLMARKERTMLFLSSEDAKNYIPENGLWVHADSRTRELMDKLDGHYVLLVGTFIATGSDSVHLSSGEIKDVRNITQWSENPDDHNPNHP